MSNNLNATFGLTLSTDVCLRPSEGGAVTGRPVKLLLVGASHMERLAKALKETGMAVCVVVQPGWRLTAESVDRMIECVRCLGVQQGEILVVQGLDNAMYYSLDENRSMKLLEKDKEDKKFHSVGELAVAGESQMDRLATLLKPLLELGEKG